ncbi:xyloglucan endotransglucosylase/hydrolase protein 2 [Phtheirospermum japonicum]|uniref:Xyloglucan endotransglucosylase/hydrolase protein 2 n=1 Tax=Phtheirospermum japonicum TaxID=374723 RepID=A0A830CNT8_9LAMI|nr:xyloglucan endotransglucosylase/hydrolase protein 2 [Phtheirospermum japonicum]
MTINKSIATRLIVFPPLILQLISLEDNAPGGNHDELDFELLGRNGPPYVLSTNVFAQDSGNREQQFNLWFDPTSDFHDYAILWNQYQIVFYVDKIPVRVFENNTYSGAKYPNLPMYVHGSLWNASQWLGPTDWSQGPFYANYRGFEVYGCTRSNAQNCERSWKAPHYRKLSAEEQRIYETTKAKYMTYDYCKSNSGKSFPECKIAN